MRPELFEIKCPFQRLGKTNGKMYVCNSLCGKLTAGSSGELHCRKCRLNFWFEIDGFARQRVGVLVKKIDKKET